MTQIKSLWLSGYSLETVACPEETIMGMALWNFLQSQTFFKQLTGFQERAFGSAPKRGTAEWI